LAPLSRADWFENFDDGVLEDWVIVNPEPGQQPITIVPSTQQCVSREYSLKIDSPAMPGYGGRACGPDPMIDIHRPYTIEFMFRYSDVHYFKFVQFAHVHLTIDYPDLPIKFDDATGQHFWGPDFDTYCSTDMWTHFKFIVHPKLHSYDFFVNGTKIGTITYEEFDPDTGGLGFCIIDWWLYTDYVRDAYYDDIYIHQSAGWADDFDDGVLEDWTVINPDPGQLPITIEPSKEQCVSPEYSLKIDSPALPGYGGLAYGPDPEIDIYQPYAVEFMFRYSDVHYFKYVQFAHVHLTIDYPDLPIKYDDATGQHFWGPDFETYCPAGMWTHFKFIVNPASHSYDFFADGTKIGTIDYEGFDPDTARKGFGIIEWSTYDNYIHNGYYDDVRIYQNSIFVDSFNDNQVDSDSWSEVLGSGVYFERNNRVEMEIYESGGPQIFEGIKCRAIPVLLDQKKGIEFRWDNFTDIGSSATVGQIIFKIMDESGANWIEARYARDLNKTEFRDSTDPGTYVVLENNKQDGYWKNNICVLKNKYYVRMDSAESGFITHSVFAADARLQILLCVEIGGSNPGLFLRAGFGDVIATPHVFTANSLTLSKAEGGEIDFNLCAGKTNAFKKYFILCGATGTLPGTTVPGGAVLPLNWDSLTDLLLPLANTILFPDFYGTTDASGRCKGKFDSLGPLPPDIPTDMLLYFALLFYDPFGFVTNAQAIRVVE
ncbi:MAG: hypothetical protein ABIK28_15930, partial [Planctomycetota bacterium]